MYTLNVEKPSSRSQTFVHIREFRKERSLTDVLNMTMPLAIEEAPTAHKVCACLLYEWTECEKARRRRNSLCLKEAASERPVLVKLGGVKVFSRKPGR